MGLIRHDKGCSRDTPNRLGRNDEIATMAMPQRDDSPSCCALRRTSTIEAIKLLDALLEHAVMHDDEEEAECIREELRRLTDEV